VGARDLPPPRPRRAFPIAQVVPGRTYETKDGDAFVVETRYAPDYQQGNSGLYRGGSLRTLAELANDPRLAVEAPQHTLAYLDTETTGLGRGPGTYAFLVGLGRWDGDSFYLAQFFMADPAQEQAMLSALDAFLASCHALVTFNGKGFDVPLLNTRYITNGREPPLPELAHLDLLPLARRLWRDRLPSRALGSLEQYILGLTRSQEDVPGWMIPQLYFDYLRSGDARPLKSVFYHNALDVLSMAALLKHIAALLDDPLHTDAIEPIDLLGIGRLYESLGRPESAVALYERALSSRLPGDLGQRTRQRLSFIQKRRERWPAAIALWRAAAAEDEVYACVELAKFYEHQERDFQEAIHWTRHALVSVSRSGYPNAARQRWLPELHHRLARLRRRIERQERPHS
jgi:uncharacterized protein YprB with RNaseH-like and TPR domain